MGFLEHPTGEYHLKNQEPRLPILRIVNTQRNPSQVTGKEATLFEEVMYPDGTWCTDLCPPCV